jgi:hypothetical protein
VRVDNDAFSGTPIPPEEPTAENPPNGAVLDYYLPGAARAVALRVYDANHQLVRLITSAPPSPAPHPPLPIAERWFPPPQRLETSAGMHRFVWSLAWGPSGKLADGEPDDGEGRTARAPRVAPGTYSVALEVNGENVATEALLVVKDPRSPATPAQFAQAYATSRKIFRDSREGSDALAEIAAVKEQLDKTLGNAAAEGTPALLKAKELRAALDPIVEGNSGLDAATMEMITALNAVESSDRPAPSQALAVYQLGRTAAHTQLRQWAMFKSGPLTALNQELKAQGLAPLAIPGGERHE